MWAGSYRLAFQGAHGQQRNHAVKSERDGRVQRWPLSPPRSLGTFPSGRKNNHAADFILRVEAQAKLKTANHAFVQQDSFAGGVHQLLRRALELMFTGFCELHSFILASTGDIIRVW